MLQTELVPAQDNSSKRLMVILHGLGDSMDGYRWLPAALQLPWMNYLLVNAPDGYYAGYSWYDFAENPAPGVKRSRELLFKLADDLRAKGYPTEQTMFFGFSQGCLMTLEVGLRYPHSFAGLIGVSGYAHEPDILVKEISSVAKQQRFLITHGTHDALIPFQAVKQMIRGFKEAGLQMDWREFHKAHTIAGDDEINVIRDFVKACYAEK